LDSEVKLQGRGEFVSKIHRLLTLFFFELLNRIANWTEIVVLVQFVNLRVIEVLWLFLSAEVDLVGVATSAATGFRLRFRFIVVVDDFGYHFRLFLLV
jgi:hypothetical protein